jgi:pyrroloquinoline quinone biosynthesis protein D
VSAGLAELTPHARPRLSTRARLQYDPVREKQVLLFPEGLLVLNETAAAVLALCDGQRSAAEIAAELGALYRHPVDQDVLSLLNRLASKRLVEVVASDER